jgi:hypothetical protein
MGLLVTNVPLLEHAFSLNVTALLNGHLSSLVPIGICPCPLPAHPVQVVYYLVELEDVAPHVVLLFVYKDKLLLQHVKLIAKPSNLGKGTVWYFQCPKTGRLCRKLYCFQDSFLHRLAYPTARYECQTYSSSVRYLKQQFDKQAAHDELESIVHWPYAKSHYRCVPTKRITYLKSRLDGFNEAQFLQLLLASNKS